MRKTAKGRKKPPANYFPCNWDSQAADLLRGIMKIPKVVTKYSTCKWTKIRRVYNLT